MSVVRSLILRGSIAAVVLAAPAVAVFEGKILSTYADPAAIPTICMGHTATAARVTQRAPAECDAILTVELLEHNADLRECVKREMPPRVEAAFTSAVYNLGVPAICNSQTGSMLKDGQWDAACNRLTLWDKARVGGVLVPLPGLTKRRAAERTMCLTGVWPNVG